MYSVMLTLRSFRRFSDGRFQRRVLTKSNFNFLRYLRGNDMIRGLNKTIRLYKFSSAYLLRNDMHLSKLNGQNHMQHYSIIFRSGGGGVVGPVSYLTVFITKYEHIIAEHYCNGSALSMPLSNNKISDMYFVSYVPHELLVRGKAHKTTEYTIPWIALSLFLWSTPCYSLYTAMLFGK